MAYKLFVTERAEELLDDLMAYHIYRLKNEQSARSLLAEIGRQYDRITSDPRMFPLVEDHFLKSRGYRRAIVKNYLLLYLIDEEKEEVYIMGIFHNLEDYRNKL